MNNIINSKYDIEKIDNFITTLSYKINYKLNLNNNNSYLLVWKQIPPNIIDIDSNNILDFSYDKVDIKDNINIQYNNIYDNFHNNINKNNNETISKQHNCIIDDHNNDMINTNNNQIINNNKISLKSIITNFQINSLYQKKNYNKINMDLYKKSIII